MDPGGTANLAVLGGNLPPSFGTDSVRTNGCIPGAPRRTVESPATRGGAPFHPNFSDMVKAERLPAK